MRETDSDRIPADLRPVAELLEEQRPQATALQLDRIASRARASMRRGANGGRERKGFFRPRLVLTAMLTVGVIMSGAGASLAISGISGSRNAAEAQYRVTTTPPPGGNTQSGNAGVKDEQLASPTTPTGTADQNAVQPANQVATGGGDNKLPFTGLAAIPILLGGLVLFAGGLVIRRRDLRSTER
jgi:hypothetical protein